MNKESARDFLKTITYPAYRLSDSVSGPCFFGRWFVKDGKMSTVTGGDWFVLLVSGTEQMSFTFEGMNPKSDITLAIIVDEKEPDRQKGPVVKAVLPDNGFHIVRVMVDAVQGPGNKFKCENGCIFKGMDAGTGEVTGIEATNKVMAFFGDSMAEGCHVLKGEDTVSEQSAYYSYPGVAARELGCIPYMAGYSSSGLRVTGSYAYCIDAINYNAEGYPVTPIKLDRIVIAHGTNDHHDNNKISPERFEEALREAIDRLAVLYPGTPVSVLIAFKIFYREEIMRVAADYSHVSVIDPEGWDVSTADGTHPDRKGSEIAGRKIAESIKKESR